jgi:hypothetical protein
MPGIITPTADFSASNLGRIIQLTTNRTGLVGEFIYGRNFATTALNSAGVGSGAILTQGTPPAPVYGDHQLELGNGVGFNTNIPWSAAMTIMIATDIQQTDAASITNSVLFIGSSVVDDGEVIMDAYVGTPMEFNAVGHGLVNLPSLPTRPLSDFRALTGRIGGLASGSPISIDEYKSGVRTQGRASTTTSARTLPNTGSVLIGGHIGYPSGGSFSTRPLFVSALIWNVALSDAATLAAYLEFRTALAAMGKAI